MISEEAFHSRNDWAGVGCTMKKNNKSHSLESLIRWELDLCHTPRLWWWCGLVPRKLFFTFTWWCCVIRLTTFWVIGVALSLVEPGKPGSTRNGGCQILEFWVSFLRLSFERLFFIQSERSLENPLLIEKREMWRRQGCPLWVLWRPWRQFNPNTRSASIEPKVFAADGFPADCQCV